MTIMAGRATIYDVAAEAGVSVATVSRVLNKSPWVADATRQRVLSTIRDLRFKPDRLARSLANGRRNAAQEPRGAQTDAVQEGPEPAVCFEGAWSGSERDLVSSAVARYEQEGSEADRPVWLCIVSDVRGAPVYVALRLGAAPQPALAATAEELAEAIGGRRSPYPVRAATS